MAIKNNQNISLEVLKEKLEEQFPIYQFEMNDNSLTAIASPTIKLNIVAMSDGEEFWITEAVPFIFKMVIVITLITMFAYWVQLQGWHWAINIGLYVVAFIVLGYIANWFYGLVYANDYKDFKPKIRNAIKEISE